MKIKEMTIKPLNHKLNLDDPNDVDWLYAWAQEAEKLIEKYETQISQFFRYQLNERKEK